MFCLFYFFAIPFTNRRMFGKRPRPFHPTASSCMERKPKICSKNGGSFSCSVWRYAFLKLNQPFYLNIEKLALGAKGENYVDPKFRNCLGCHNLVSDHPKIFSQQFPWHKQCFSLNDIFMYSM